MSAFWLPADWPQQAGLHAGTTLRGGGCSLPPYDGLNLADHVGDDPQAVQRNRDLLQQQLPLPAAPRWLQQVHGTDCVRLFGTASSKVPVADAAWTDEPGVVCAVLTADCLPILLADMQGPAIAAVHAGWRGLAGGVFQATLQSMAVAPARLQAWIGPAISATHFEVGEEVLEVFRGAGFPEDLLDQRRPETGRPLLDLAALCRWSLRALGLNQIHGADHCCYADQQRYYSHRRSAPSGRMASLIWRDDRI